ncbi:MAG: protein kinase [Alphaproteobacteria bacterium]|nr:protein kinase [Alphaproteobacteria bacterium]
MARVEGQRLGRYTLVRKLGQGGGGEAWEAVLHGPMGFSRPVALKLLPEDRAAVGAEDLVREARLGALLQHPNLVGTYELAEADGVVFLAMELVRGVSIRELAASASLHGAAVLEIGVQACAGLSHLHQLRVDDGPVGVVHRDVKPGNLLVDRSGLVKLVDFGISRFAGGSGHLSGTPSYSPPEQYLGTPDARSDLFSLAATLFTVVARQPPFGRGVRLSREAVRRGLARRGLFDEVEHRVPGLGAVLARCLAPDPDDRPASADELGRALAALRSRQRPGPPLRELVGLVAPDTVGGVPTDRTPPVEVEPTLVVRGNLPVSRGAFVGRDELPRVRALLTEGQRLITLLGPGGMGKTRLSIEAARSFGADQGVATWFFDLAEARDADAVCATVGRALSVELPERDEVERLGHALRALGRAVVVLDNLEQVVEAMGPVVERWRALAPDASWLCTSRIPLRLPGERRVPVGALTLEEGVALYAQRAASPPTDEELPLVRRLVEELEGMPLAIELCAARSARMDLVTMLARTDDRLRLLAGGGSERPERHRSVQASLEGSWELLPAWARQALARLSVFEGGFAAAAAGVVLGALADRGRWGVDVLQTLCDDSLLRYDPDHDRFGMLAVVQVFASEKLGEAERRAAEIEHGRWFAQLGAQDALDALRVHGGTEREAALRFETDNLLAACRRAIRRGDVAVAVPTVRALDVILSRTGPTGPLRDLLLDVRAMPALHPDDPAAMELELDAAWAATKSGRAREALAELEELLRRTSKRHPRVEGRTAILLSLEYNAHGQNGLAEVTARRALDLARETGSVLAEISAAFRLGQALRLSGAVDEAERWFLGAMKLARDVGDRRSEGVGHGLLGHTYHSLGRFREARRSLLRALAVHRELGDRFQEAARLNTLGLMEKDLGRVDEARRVYREALRLHRELGDRASEHYVLGCLGFLELELGDPDACAPFLADAATIAAELGETSMRAQWEAAMGRYHALRGRVSEATAAIGRGEQLLRAGEVGSTRVWVEAARAEVQWRTGDVQGALRSLEQLEAWLSRRTTDRAARTWLEVSRVRGLMEGDEE